MSPRACQVGGLLRALLAETPLPQKDAPVEDLVAAGLRVMAARQTRIAEAGQPPAHVAETHAECEALLRRLSIIDEEWRVALQDARTQIAAQLRSTRQLQKFAAAR